MTQHHMIPLIFTALFILFSSSIARHTITPLNPLQDNEALFSISGSFALGFFNLTQENRYIGLWYNNIPNKTIVMVINRENPLVNSPGVLSITSNGVLIITDKDSRVVWSSNITTELMKPVAQLLDDGNFIVKERSENSLNYTWQSFDHPTDTLLPGMKLAVNLTTGMNSTLTSWSSLTDPTPGEYQLYIETKGDPELFLVKGVKRLWRSGPWDGAHLSGVPWKYHGYNDILVNYTYSYKLETSIPWRLSVTSTGDYQHLNWIESSKQWSRYWSMREDDCDEIGKCGNYGLCDKNNSPACSCLPGFKPKSPANWNMYYWSDGCVRQHELGCVNGTDRFVAVTNVKLPQSGNCTVDLSLSHDQCTNLCLKNCSCTAYASAIAANNSGCVIWIGELFDMRNYGGLYGQVIYVRLNAIDVPEDSPGGKPHDVREGSPSGKSHGRVVAVVVVVVVVSLVAGILLLGCVFYTRKKKKREFVSASVNSFSVQFKHEQKSESIDLPIFSFNAIMKATNSFSSHNKLGEGGFGPVYKGSLGDDQEIAVKRLSKTSSQGLEEFKNEVMLIAKLQHRNLVSLLGCCIQGEERMLIYEYLPNSSLDAFLFNKGKNSLLNWNMRYQIIIGIARGLLYLHHDSRLRIIHRDLKAGNILLDNEMIPKISDFGMARIFSSDGTDFNTKKIVGTYGYMSPEYAMDGVFSVKSDVFSFGVLVIEIISGRRNRRAYPTPLHINLLSHAWSLWKEGNGMQLVDDSMNGLFSNDEVSRCIKIGLLCVQEHPEDRPLMSSIVQMIGSDIKTIPLPKQPGFTTRGFGPSSNIESCSNELSITMFEPR